MGKYHRVLIKLSGEALADRKDRMILDAKHLFIVAEAIKKMGSTHENTSHGQVIIDKGNNVFTTPCYMLDADIVQIGEGAENIVRAMLKHMQ